jgi:hypothetical protein
MVPELSSSSTVTNNDQKKKEEDKFFSIRRVFRFCRLAGGVPFLPRGPLNLENVDAALIRERSSDNLESPPMSIPSDIQKSDIEYVWQVVGALHSSAVPPEDWDSDSHWTVAGIKLYAAVKLFVERILCVAAEKGISLSQIGGAKELALAIRDYGAEMGFLDHAQAFSSSDT